MQHTVEDLSPVKKNVAISIPTDEVNAAINKAVAQYRMKANIPGFRKGKAPLGMVEKRFADDIYSDALNNLVNESIDAALREADVTPLGNLKFEGELPQMKRDTEFAFAFSFEVKPEIVLPAYEGIGVDEEEVKVDDGEIDDVVTRLRSSMAELTPVDEKRLPQDGDVVTMDFAGTDEAGEPVPGVSGENFQVSLGEGQVIPDFEALTRTAAPGETVEGKVVFPEDYGHAPLAGKTVNMKITAKSLQQKKLPELDDAFAKKASGLETVEAMRDSIRTSFTRNRQEMAKGHAQTKLIEALLEKVDFPLPEGMVERYTQNILQDRLEKLTSENKKLAELGEGELDTMKAEAEVEAKKYAKMQLFLLTVAEREELEVTTQDVTVALRQIAMRGGRDVKEVQEYYARNNMFGPLRDRLLSDKAVETIYMKAKGEKATEIAGGASSAE